MEQILFYTFSFGALISGFFVISSTNPIHSVFSLVLAFANTSCLLLMLGVEFLAFLFLIVYIGAIAILFLFVVMMLDIRLVEILDNATRYLPIGFLIGILFLIELTIIIDEKHFSNLNIITTVVEDYTSIELLGNILYTDGFYHFLISSIVLLVSMIGAILLTLYHESEVKRQDIFFQIICQIGHLRNHILIFINLAIINQ